MELTGIRSSVSSPVWGSFLCRPVPGFWVGQSWDLRGRWVGGWTAGWTWTWSGGGCGGLAPAWWQEGSCGGGEELRELSEGVEGKV